MSNYLIIDSNKRYAAELYKALTGSDVDADECIIDTTNFVSASKVFIVVNPKIKDNSKKIVLINAETELKDNYLQHQPIIELAFWIRCRYNSLNPIVFYSGVSVNHSLKQNPENFILLSPNCYYYKLPITKSNIEAIQKLKPIAEVDLKPYLKPAISLEQVRHRYANYAGMALMLKVALIKHYGIKGSDILKSQSLDDFMSSLDYHLLKTYFNLNYKDFPKKIDATGFIPHIKKILLVDDLAVEGWKAIIGQMIYGNSSAAEIKSVTLQKMDKSETDKTQVYDEAKTIEELETQIKEHKPHLILLDLRLNDEEGRKNLSELGGYKLLSHLKKSPLYKGVQVIMFTASSNAETVKQLIGNGAYGVWTKPGIDEGLTVNGIIKRYDQLLQLVSEIFNPDYSFTKNLNDNYEEKFQIDELDIEKVCNLLLSKVDFIKYRLELFSKSERENLIPEPYKSADAIYIDSNLFISGEGIYNYPDMITSVVKLALLTRESECSFISGTHNSNTLLPKVVIMNPVFDEVMKYAKTGSCEKIIDEVIDNSGNKSYKFNRYKLAYIRAALSQLIIKNLFEGKAVRTELYVSETKIAFSNLENPKENIYADGYILDEIANLLLTRKSMAFKFKPTTKVVFVSGDLALGTKLKSFGNKDKDNICIIEREKFTKNMEQIII